MTIHPIRKLPSDLDRVAQFIRAIDSKVRIHILYLLHDKPRCVHELVSVLGSSQPLVSQHLKVLKKAGLVAAERRGREIFYSLSSIDVIPILDSVSTLVHGDMKTIV
ncbi:metalloregulator ArsR/SmtB family transcription factor [Staphylococcus chromogenes]|nr:metalloregulator ArsR/SmtB family transcription factor [Staphylococcus chromogenes]